jgi:hypothetical protein
MTALIKGLPGNGAYTTRWDTTDLTMSVDPNAEVSELLDHHRDVLARVGLVFAADQAN